MGRIDNVSKGVVFGALKLLEQLYLEGDLPGFIFRNALKEYSDTVNMLDFKCHVESQEVISCMD